MSLVLALSMATACQSSAPTELPMGDDEWSTSRPVLTTAAARSEPSSTITAPTLLDCPRRVHGDGEPKVVYFKPTIDADKFVEAWIEYGDGSVYESSTWADAERNMFWHRYVEDGWYVVKLFATFHDGRTDQVSCTFALIQPRQTTTTPSPAPSTSPNQSECHPSYVGACVPRASDVDCASGSGNGPAYVRGPVRVVGTDVYGLDRDNDGIGCQNG